MSIARAEPGSTDALIASIHKIVAEVAAPIWFDGLRTGAVSAALVLIVAFLFAQVARGRR